MTSNRFFAPERHRTLLGLLPLLVLAACGSEPTSDRSTAAALDPVVVEVRTATLETVPRMIRVNASVEPLRRVSPGSKILGRVALVAAREGDRVDRGALLARLESRDLEAAERQTEAAVRMAEATLDNARAQRDRMVGLHQRGSVTTKTLEDASAGFKVAEAGLEQAQANLAAARVALGYAEIRSPASGWVVTRRIEVGDMATPGAPLFTLEDLSRVEVIAQVPESDVVGLAEGSSARVEIMGRETAAVVHRVVPAGDPASRTFEVRLLLDNPQGIFKSGLFARVSFAGGDRQALRVPAASILSRGQLEGLFIAGDDGRVRLRWVKAGQTADGLTDVLSGLEVGERYLPAPPTGVTDGTSYQEADR